MLLAKPRAAPLAALLLIAVFGPALADPKPSTTGLERGPIVVNATPIRSFRRLGDSGPDLGRLKFRGGLVLTSPSPAFGGWSGLILDDDAKGFLAISDSGVWMTGRIAYDSSRPSGIEDARLGPLPGIAGSPRSRDSESVALAEGTLARGMAIVGFESRHRIERYALSGDGPTADRGPIALPREARHMHANQGLEAMTVMKGGPFKGALIAFSERLYDLSRNHTGWLWTPQGPQTIHLENIGDYDLTDLSSLDDGTLFVLERRFRWTEGVKMRLVRVPAEEIRPGRTLKGETLIEADLTAEIDNMEGLAVTRLENGGILITMISDDNFNHLLQRTLLLQFALEDRRQAETRPQD